MHPQRILQALAPHVDDQAVRAGRDILTTPANSRDPANPQGLDPVGSIGPVRWDRSLPEPWVSTVEVAEPQAFASSNKITRVGTGPPWGRLAP